MGRKIFCAIFALVFLLYFFGFDYLQAQNGGKGAGKKSKRPKVVKIIPNKGAPGQTLDITIKGRKFVQTPTVILGGNIQVNSVDYVSVTKLKANITIPDDAKKGPKAVTVTNPDNKKSQPKRIFSVIPVKVLITIENFSFNPENITVSPGTVIRVKNKDSFAHSVTSESNAGDFTCGEVNGISFDTGPFTTPAKTIKIPSNAPTGTVIPYFCTVHKSLMTTPTGTITIQ